MENVLFSNLTPEEIVTLVAVFGIIVGDTLNDNELAVLANFMVSAGVALLIMVSQRALIKNQEQAVTQSMQIEKLQKEVDELKQLLNNHDPMKKFTNLF
jgi:hypothetical protein